MNSFSAQSIFHLPSYMKCHSSLHSITQNKRLLLVNHNYGCLILLTQKMKPNIVVSFHQYLSMLALLFLIRLFGHLFSMCYTFHGATIRFHGTSNRNNSRTLQWNSSGLIFHLKIDAVFYSCIISSFIS